MADHVLGAENGQRDLRAHDLERLMEAQIRDGVYDQGARLPTVRELAQRYGVNKNTASRAYQALERRGIIAMARGRGAFVRAPHSDSGRSWQEQAEQLVHDAQRLGVTRDQLRDLIDHAVEQIYGPAGPRVVFVECNRQDLATLGSELGAIAATTMELALLDDALRDAADLARRYDLIVTPFQHLGQLRQAVPVAARNQVVGVHATPSHASLFELARLHVTTFGLVCDTPSTIEGLSHIIATYNPGATVLPALIDDDAQLAGVVEGADAIVVTRSCRERLMALGVTQPVVTVVFTVDQQSIDFLRRRVYELNELRAGRSTLEAQR